MEKQERTFVGDLELKETRNIMLVAVQSSSSLTRATILQEGHSHPLSIAQS
jgi:hypothetical protein